MPSLPAPFPPSPPGRTLVVDDNESIRAFLKYFFKVEGLPVEIMASSQAALERFRAAPQDFALLMTDCEMPGMNGLELAQHVRQVRPVLPTIIFPTAVAVHGPGRFLTMGFVDALPKPVSIAKLRAAVWNAVAGKPPPGV